jgi:hypothetical protein
MISQNQRGFLLILVIVFGAVFFLIISSFVTYIVSQYQLQVLHEEEQRARNIAEGGLNYYRWYLAHYPNDITNGTTTPGPYVHPYSDPEGGVIGEFSLEIASSSACGAVQAIDILSTGYTTTSPSVQRTLYGRYAQPTVTEYAYIINSNVWVGSDHDILGPYHSNGIVRMDGTNNSTVTSGQETWVCDGSISCSPASVGSTVNAVYGNGPNNSLWTYPSPPINFLSLTVDLANMKTRAQNNGGVYLGPSADQGYLIEFRNDGRFDVYIVDRTWSHTEYSTESGSYTAYNLIREADFLATYTIPSACSLIFVEDKVWLRGVVDGKVTIAAADTDTVGVDPSIILHGNITYDTATSGLLAIAEEDVLVGYDVPDNMTLNGIFIAQNGKFGRNHYTSSVNGGDRYRNSLTINGTIVSNGRVGTKWTSGATWTSGFDNRYTSYDRNLVAEPPPLTPEVSDIYEFIEWREMDD